MWGRDIY